MEEKTTHPPEEITPSASKRLSWLWFSIPLLAIITLVIPWHQTNETPSEEEWSAALSILEKEIQPGEGIYVYPTWYAAPWSQIDTLLTSKKMKDRDTLVHAYPLTDLEHLRFPKLWMLAPFPNDLPEPLNDAQKKSDGSNASLFLIEKNVGKTSYDFRKNIQKAAAVRISPEGKETPCRWRKDRHRCDKKLPFTDIRTTVGEVGNTRRDAIAAHAWPDNGTLRITYKDIPLGESLVVGVGMALRSVRKERHTSATLRVLVDGSVLYEQVLSPGDFGWHVKTHQTTPKKATVVFEVSSPEADKRLVYFDAVAVK
jgi:hypothetical protein